MSSYFLVNKQNKTLEYYHSVTLFSKYLKEGYVEMSEIKEVGNIDFLVDDLRNHGVLIYSASETHEVYENKIRTGSTSSELVFDNLYVAIAYCKEKKLSVAADSYIKTALLKNLNGKTKSAYGKNWEYVRVPLEISEYKIEVIL